MNLRVHRGVPRTIALPDECRPEGIASGPKDSFYVVRNRDNRIAVVDLKRDLREGEIAEELTDPLLDVPTTIAPFGRFIYAVNARFDRPDDSDADIIRLRP